MPDLYLPNHYLSDAMKYTDEDLAANRAGTLGRSQVRRLKRMQFTLMFNAIFFLAFGVFIAGAVYTAILIVGRGIDQRIAALVGVLCAVPVILVVLGRLRRRSRLGEDIRQGRVQSVEGVVTLHEEVLPSSGTLEGKITAKLVSRSANTYDAYVAGLTFRISGKVYDAFMPNNFYRVYYSAPTMTIVAAERIEQP